MNGFGGKDEENLMVKRHEQAEAQSGRTPGGGLAQDESEGYRAAAICRVWNQAEISRASDLMVKNRRWAGT